MLATIAILVTILYFVFAGVLKSQPGQSSKQFFFMDRTATIGNYVDTTVAYSLQVAVTIYFVFWGYRYGWSNMWFVLTWCIGIFLFSLAAPRLATVLQQHETMLSFLAAKSLILRRVSAVLVVLSLFGLMYTELFFTAQFLGTSLTLYSPGLSFSAWYWITFLMLLLVITAYVSLGGAQKVVATDKQQLLLAYVAAAVFFIALQEEVAKSGAAIFYWTYIPILLTYLGLTLGCAVSAMISKGGSYRSFRLFPGEYSFASTYAPFFCAIAVGISILNPPLFGTNSRSDFPKSIWSMIEGPEHGVWALIGFGLANLIWQFSDYTAYHRLALLNLPAEHRQRTEQIRRSILATMLASPLTWSLGIFAGMAIDATDLVHTDKYGQEVFNSFTIALIQGSQGGNLALYTALVSLGVVLIAVMLSTVDSAFISAGKLLMMDFAPERALTVRFRVACLLLCSSALTLFAASHAYFQTNVFTALGVFYSWGLVFGPVMIYRLFADKFSITAAMTAIILGSMGGAIGALYPLGLPTLVSNVASQLLAMAIAAIVLFASWIFSRRAT